MPDRAVVFVDGNNWYHSLRKAGIASPGRLNLARVSTKLLGPRSWVGTRYYVGRVSPTSPDLYSEQRRFLSRLQSLDPRISVHLGRLERRIVESSAAAELRRYLADLPVRIDEAVYRDLLAIARRHGRVEVWTEKAVDVMLAVDMVTLAGQGHLDAAYLLSADGDFTPAVAAVRAIGVKVYAASASTGAALARAVQAFIPLTPSWFDDCH